MLYVTSITERPKGNDLYTIFESTTESIFEATQEAVKRLILENGVAIENIELIKDKLVEKAWSRVKSSHTIDSVGCEYTLICKTGRNKYKVVGSDASIIYINNEKLKLYTEQNRMTNCTIENGAWGSTGAYNGEADINFKKEITEKYEKYVAKTSLLGRQMSFNYIIEGREVKLKNYTGITKDVIIPNFVTSIMKNACHYLNIERLTLDEGLKSIGAYSFGWCSISELVIPKTVEILLHGAFCENGRLVVKNSYTDRVKLLNKKTVIIKNYHNS